MRKKIVYTSIALFLIPLLNVAYQFGANYGTYAQYEARMQLMMWGPLEAFVLFIAGVIVLILSHFKEKTEVEGGRKSTFLRYQTVGDSLLLAALTVFGAGLFILAAFWFIFV